MSMVRLIAQGRVLCFDPDGSIKTHPPAVNTQSLRIWWFKNLLDVVTAKAMSGQAVAMACIGSLGVNVEVPFCFQ